MSRGFRRITRSVRDTIRRVEREVRRTAERVERGVRDGVDIVGDLLNPSFTPEELEIPEVYSEVPETEEVVETEVVTPTLSNQDTLTNANVNEDTTSTGLDDVNSVLDGATNPWLDEEDESRNPFDKLLR